MHTRYIVSAIIQKEDDVLLGRKAKGRPPYPDAWHLPGGGVENSTLAAQLIETDDFNNQYLHNELQREVREELGITIKNIHCIVPQFRSEVRQAETLNKDSELTHYYFLEYLCEYAEGIIQPGDDLAEAQWIPKKRLATISLTSPSQEMYRELGWI